MALKEYDNYKDIATASMPSSFKVRWTPEFTYEKIMELTIDISKKSSHEKPNSILGKLIPQPNIGAALIHNDWVYFSARSGMKTGDHAEYTILETLIPKGENTSEDILFTTLEPCTQEARNPWSESCSRLIVNKRINHVLIGSVDANPLITGMGIRYLLNNGVDISFYPSSFSEKLKQLNKDFFGFFDDFSDFKSIRLIDNYLRNALDIDIINLYLKNLNKEQYNALDTIDGLFFFYREMLKRGYLIKGDSLTPVTITPAFALVFFKEPNKIIPGYQIDFIGRHRFTPFKGSVIKALDENVDGSIYSTIYKNYNQKQVFTNKEMARELIANAIAHNNYHDSGSINLRFFDDKIEIYNCIDTNWTPTDLQILNEGSALSLPHNPLLMELLVVLGVTEHHGYGNRGIGNSSGKNIYATINQQGFKLLVTTIRFFEIKISTKAG